jgi:WD40 repeat protein/serine/threonine protein kinase
MASSSSDRNPVERLAEEFAARLRRGERPSLSEYTAQYPQYAEQIQELFPALAMMEQLKPAEGDLTGPQVEPKPEDVPPLECLGDYRIVREVGRGGMGVVYEAEQQALGRRVALKLLPRKLLADSKQRRRFEREARLAAKLHHTNIVPVFGVGEQDGLPYYVMQFIQGLGLNEVLEELTRLRAGGEPQSAAAHPQIPAGKELSAADVARSLLTGPFEPGALDASLEQLPAGHPGEEPLAAPSTGRLGKNLSDSSVVLPGQSGPSGQRKAKPPTYWQSVAQIGVQVAGALEYAHQQSVLHRDIKPSNLLLDQRTTVWVTDFGLAKASDSADLTHTGDVLGTLRYMPPEAFEGHSDARSDLYSLGLTLYELLAFQPAFDEKDRNKLIKQVTTGEPPRLELLNAEVPRDLVTIVHKAIDRDVQQRYASAGELAADLQRFIDDEPIKARPISAAERLIRWCRHNPSLAGLLTAVAATLLLGTVVAWLLAAWALTAEQETRRQWYAASCNAMQQAWQSGQVARLRALLTETEAYPDRGFEWYYFQRLCHLDLHTLIGHRADVLVVSWSPDGKLLATGSRDGTAKVWDAVDGRELLTLHGHRGLVSSVSWSPDSKRLATASDDETVKVWEVASVRELLTLPGHTDGALSVSWSPDGKRLATGSGDGTAKVWDVDGRRELVSLKEEMGAGSSMGWSPDGKRNLSANAVSCVSWSPDGKRLATASGAGNTGAGNTKVWDATSGWLLLPLRGHRGAVLSVAWSPDGKKLATVGQGSWWAEDRTAKVWEAASGRELLTLQGDTGLVRSVSWSPDGKRLAMASAYGTVKVCESATGRELLTLKGHTGFVLSVSWSPDGKALATASEDGTAKVWKADNDRELVALSGHTSGVNITSWSPDGKRLATGSWDGTAKVWEATNGHELLPPLKGHTIAWSPDGKLLATGNEDGKVRVYDTSSSSELPPLQDNTKALYCVSWSPDGKRLAAASVDGTAKVWETTGQRELSLLQGHTNWVGGVSWSPDGKRLATTSADRTAKIWDAAEKRELLTLKGHTGWVFCAPWSPDGKRLATGSKDGTAKVWDAISGQELRTLQGHTARVDDVCWSPDGKRLATGSGDGTVKVWEAAGGRQLLTLQGHAAGVLCLSWSPDGKRLAAGGSDGVLRVWDAAGDEAVQEWSRQNRALDDLLALNAYRGQEAQSFIQTWLLLLPLPWDSAQKGEQALDLQQVEREAQLRPQLGARVTVRGQELLWQEHRSPESVVDFNAVVGHVTERSVAYAACYLESDRPRNDLWLQIGSYGRAKVYLNGRVVYQNRIDRNLESGLDTIPLGLLQRGTNTLLFKVVNDAGQDGNWEGCVRLVDAAGRPAKDIRVKLTPDP